MTAWLCVTFFGTVLELQCFKLVLLPYRQIFRAAGVRTAGMGTRRSGFEGQNRGGAGTSAGSCIVSESGEELHENTQYLAKTVGR